MKNLLYIVLLVFLIFVGFSFLLVYYTQEFNEEYEFFDEINYDDLEIQTNFRGDVKYLNSASGNLGELNLVNEGVFERIYFLPNLVGCINLKDGVRVENSKIRNYKFEVNYYEQGINYRYGQKITIPKGEKIMFKLVGQYNSYDVPLSSFSIANIDGISIYEIPKGENNPLADGYNYNYNNRKYYGDCNSLNLEFNPVAVIPFG